MSVKSSTKPDAWTLSPQMTAAPELWRGCVFLEPFWGNPKDIVYGFEPSKVEVSGYTIDIGLGSVGREALYKQNAGSAGNGAAYKYGGGNESEHDVGSEDFTAFVYCRYLNKTNICSAFGKKFTGGPGNEGWTISVNPYGTSDEQVVFILDNDGTQFILESAKGVAPIDTPFTIVGVRSGSTIELFVDGESRDANSVSGSVSNSTVPLQVGSGLSNTGSDVDWGWTGSIYMAGLCKRAWSESEIKAFSADPFAMLRPAGF